MGAKATFDPLTRVISLTEAPDVDGDVSVDVGIDLYSDGKEDWVANESLRRLKFPIRVVGGDPKPGGKKVGSTFFIRSDWKIRPYNASHRLIVVGDLSSEDGSDPFLNTLGSYTVKVMQEVSSLSTVIEVESGEAEKDWTDQEHDDILADIAAVKGKTANLPVDPADQSAVEAAIASAESNIRGADSDDLKTLSDEIAAMRTVMDKVWAVESGKWEIVGSQQRFYSGGEVLVRVNLYDADGNLTSDLSKVRKRVPV